MPRTNMLTLALLLLSLWSLLLVPVVALKYSYSPLTAAGSAAGFLLLLALCAFLGMAWLRRKRRPPPAGAVQDATRRDAPLQTSPREQAVGIGLLGGLLWAVEIGVNNFIAPPLPARDRIDNIFWAAIAVLILLGALVSAYRLKRFQAGVGFGLWSGLASGAVACGMALTVIVFGMKYILQDPLNLTEWAARFPGETAPAMAAYFAYQTLAGAFLHLVVLGVGMGFLLGALGGGIGRGLRVAGKRLG
jgi:hypothetical protein